MAKLKIAEIFGPTIQGEGAVIGVPTVFVRAGGCDFRCTWCDSLHAVDADYRKQWQAMSEDEIMEEVSRLSGAKPLLVSLSGGNPAIQDFAPLIRLGKTKDYRFVAETQGSVARDWFRDLFMLILSPKPPSSGQSMDFAIFDQCLSAAADVKTVLKIVIFDEADYLWARQVAERYPQLDLFLQPGNHTPPSAFQSADQSAPISDGIDMKGIMSRMEWLIERSLADQWYRPRILPQLHVILWGNRQGV